ncbi:MAG: C40 family peptidase [FCB group bacterium]|nr:C40 family peptidase [FCB group bacterium]
MKKIFIALFVISINILSATMEIQRVLIISKINESEYSTESKISSVDDELRMSFVIETKINGEKHYYSDIDNIILKGLDINNNVIQNLTNLSKDIIINWYKIEEADGNNYNNCSPQWHWEEISYKETKLAKWDNRSIIIPDVKPTIFTPVYCDNKIAGTMRYKVTINLNNKTYSSKGKTSKYKGSISDKIHRISLKGNTNNEVINYAFAMCNLPYIWGSANFSNSSNWDNQAERFIGADCADFAVAAHQLAGNQIPYDSIKNLTHTEIITTVELMENGNYLNNRKQQIEIGDNGIQIGDFVYWNFDQQGAGHVGLFFKDKSNPNGRYEGRPDGVFNKWDLVIHTLFHEPEIKSIETAYSGNIRIYRFQVND